MNINVSLMEKVQAALAEALQTPLTDITPDLSLGDIPQWDSMGHMEVMMLLERKFGIEINADTISALVSVPAICDYIDQNHKSS